MTNQEDRREFLRRSLIGGGLGMASLGLGSFHPLFARELEHELRGAGKDRVLVIVQLSGGNDGLSTLVPYADDGYHQARRQTRHQAQNVLKLDDYAGLNPGLKSLHALYEAGSLAVLPGCGYPSPNRSHFKSMDIWHAADLKGNSQPYGWLGRFADSVAGRTFDPNLVIGIGKKAENAIIGKRVKPVAFTSPQAYRYVAKEDQFETFDKLNESKTSGEETNLDFLRRVSRDAKSSSYRIRRALSGYQTKENYGAGGPLGNDLRTAAAVIAAKLPTRVIYCTMGGYDTHVNQRNTHDRNMRQLDAALGAFQRDLKKNGQADRVTTMVFSEFGRRVSENASGGTDHGAAGTMLVLGKSVKGGIHGKQPSLKKLERGDLVMTQDFRAVYASLLEGWLGGDPKKVLGHAALSKGLFA